MSRISPIGLLYFYKIPTNIYFCQAFLESGRCAFKIILLYFVTLMFYTLIITVRNDISNVREEKKNGTFSDNLISAALLHNVCEDCAIPVSELPVNQETQAEKWF